MIDRDKLQELIKQELGETSQEEAKNEIKSEESAKKDVSESISEVGTSEQEVVNESQEDPYLKEAIEMGYDPNYKGANRKSPEQFVKDGSFFKKIDAQKKEIQELKNLMKQQIEHTRKVERAAAEKMLSEAKAEKENTFKDGDIEGYKLAEAKEQAAIKQMEDNKIETQQTVSKEPELPEEIKSWARENQKYFDTTTKEGQRRAIVADQLYNLSEREAADNGETRSIKEHLKFVEDKLQALYPNLFENPNTSKPAVVAKSTTSSVQKTSLASKLSERQRQFAESARRVDPSFSVEQYAKELKLTGELRDE